MAIQLQIVEWNFAPRMNNGVVGVTQSISDAYWTREDMGGFLDKFLVPSIISGSRNIHSLDGLRETANAQMKSQGFRYLGELFSAKDYSLVARVDQGTDIAYPLRWHEVKSEDDEFQLVGVVSSIKVLPTSSPTYLEAGKWRNRGHIALTYFQERIPVLQKVQPVF